MIISININLQTLKSYASTFLYSVHVVNLNNVYVYVTERMHMKLYGVQVRVNVFSKHSKLSISTLIVSTTCDKRCRNDYILMFIYFLGFMQT